MNQYHTIKPGVAAILEHVLCESFAEEIHLLLNAHQLESLNAQEKAGFEAWLGKPVVWQERTNESGESLLEKKQREADEYTRKLWQQAEADPNVQALKSTLGCRVVNVKPPVTTFENSDGVTPLEEE